MVFSFAKPTCVMTFTLGILIGLGGRANAASIVQSVDYDLLAHGSQYGFYNQFDPRLGTLSDVIIQCQGTTSLPDYFVFTNNSNVAQTYTGTVSYTENTDGGSTVISNTFKDTLGPGQYEYEGASGGYDLSTSYGNNSFWVGTGLLDTFGHVSGLPYPAAVSSNPNVTASMSSFFVYSDRGTETVTYLYVPAGVPEPPAYMLLGTACLGLLAVRYTVGTRTWGQAGRS